MTISLRIIGGGPHFDIDPRFLNITDVPFVLLAVICLFVAYYKIKKTKNYDSPIDDISEPI